MALNELFWFFFMISAVQPVISRQLPNIPGSG